MAHGTRISGVNKAVTAGFTRINGVNKKVTKGLTLVGGVQKVINFGKQGTSIGEFAVKQSIYTPVDGVLKEFVIVHQGIPSSDYDDSCYGTWLMLADLYKKQKWGGSTYATYPGSTVDTYLNKDFYGLFDAGIQSQIKTVKIPCYDSSGGLSTKIFLPSKNEVNASSTSFRDEGSVLSYFSGANDNARKAYLNGTVTAWWLRTRHNVGSSVARIGTDGKISGYSPTSSYGIRPIFILPQDALVDENFQIIE